LRNFVEITRAHESLMSHGAAAQLYLLAKVAALSPDIALTKIKNELRCSLGRIEFVPANHFFAQGARLAE
jgi:hypothetical protein